MELIRTGCPPNFTDYCKAVYEPTARVPGRVYEKKN